MDGQNSKKKKKQFPWQMCLVFAIFMIFGYWCGIYIGKFMSGITENKSIGERLFVVAALFVGIYVAGFLQIIIHEAGHLVFGLLTGYKFSSFRIGSFMWIKEENKLSFRRLTIAGTGGQCLMVPPAMKDGKLPVVLYNIGGSLMNILTGILFLALYFILGEVSIFGLFFIMTAIVGFAFAIVNGVPLRLGEVDNDGYNAVSLGKSSDALYSFWVQMKANQQIAKGIRLKDMPEEWFTVPSDEQMKNSMVAVRGVFACNRLMDQHHFEEADKLMEHLLTIDSSIVGIHRNLMICDRIYCELVGECREEKLQEMYTKELQKFMKSMKTFPTVLRTKYLYASFVEKDEKKAEGVLAQFEKTAGTYPYPSEIVAERELIELAVEKKVFDK